MWSFSSGKVRGRVRWGARPTVQRSTHGRHSPPFCVLYAYVRQIEPWCVLLQKRHTSSRFVRTAISRSLRKTHYPNNTARWPIVSMEGPVHQTDGPGYSLLFLKGTGTVNYSPILERTFVFCFASYYSAISARAVSTFAVSLVRFRASCCPRSRGRGGRGAW